MKKFYLSVYRTETKRVWRLVSGAIIRGGKTFCRMNRRGIFLSLLGIAVFSWVPAHSEEVVRPSFNTGYQVASIRYHQGEEKKTITVALWYPTKEQAKVHTYGAGVTGKVATDARICPEGAPYPLFVFSHGYGGSGLAAVYLTEILASCGWIVAAPDHNDRYSAVRIPTGPVPNCNRRNLLKHAAHIAASTPENRGEYLYRIKEMEQLLKWVLSVSPLHDFIDQKRVAVGGHSFGGFTALGVCGTIKEYYDPRIRAVVLFSTGVGGSLFTDQELHCVKIPSMLFLGELERDALRGRNQTMAEIADKIYRNMPAPKYFLEIRGAHHLSFVNQFITELFEGNNRLIFEVIRRYTIAFLKKHISGRREAETILDQQDSLLTRYLRTL